MNNKLSIVNDVCWIYSLNILHIDDNTIYYIYLIYNLSIEYALSGISSIWIDIFINFRFIDIWTTKYRLETMYIEYILLIYFILMIIQYIIHIWFIIWLLKTHWVIFHQLKSIFSLILYLLTYEQLNIDCKQCILNIFFKYTSYWW